MQKVFNIALSLIMLIGVGAGTWYYFTYLPIKERGKDSLGQPSVKIVSFEECAAAGNPVMESYPRQCQVEGKTFVEDIGNELEKRDLIQISYPRPNQTISSPLRIVGEARGYWFFEADFPIFLIDAGGNVIATTIATAQSEWMTENFVPFEATLMFESDTQKGMIVFEKDNPSGLPEHSDSLLMPVLIVKSKTPSARSENGTVKGSVTIGPVCPVERDGVPCEIHPEIYTSRELIIFDKNRNTEVTRSYLDEKGAYFFELSPGIYVLDIARQGIDRSSELPKEIVVETGQTIIFDFSIDTGIR